MSNKVSSSADMISSNIKTKKVGNFDEQRKKLQDADILKNITTCSAQDLTFLD